MFEEEESELNKDDGDVVDGDPYGEEIPEKLGRKRKRGKKVSHTRAYTQRILTYPYQSNRKPPTHPEKKVWKTGRTGDV